MDERKTERRHAEAWKAQEEAGMQITLEEVCTRARRLERQSFREFWMWMVMLGFLVTVLSVYLVEFPQPLVKMSCVSGIFIFLYLGVRVVRGRQSPRFNAAARSEACVAFLRAELERQRDEALHIRWVMCLLFPGALGFWWGGGTVAAAGWLGIDWPWLLRVYASPGPLVASAVLMALTWIGCGKEAQSLEREIELLSKQASS
ncbi:MAG: hypothetical protein OXJ55_14900 [Caldilineaceae bacterium]|nr:hypothetical protein [Caldilineaceae bacterium]